MVFSTGLFKHDSATEELVKGTISYDDGHPFLGTHRSGKSESGMASVVGAGQRHARPVFPRRSPEHRALSPGRIDRGCGACAGCQLSPTCRRRVPPKPGPIRKIRATGPGRHGSADHKPLIGRESQNSRTILDASESQTPQGVRGADGADVLLACGYTISGSLPQGM